MLPSLVDMIIFYELLSHFDWFITYNPLEDKHIDYVSWNYFFLSRKTYGFHAPVRLFNKSQKSSKCDKNKLT